MASCDSALRRETAQKLESVNAPSGASNPELSQTKNAHLFGGHFRFVASEGFEPPKAEPAELQSDPFGRLGN